jgi:hypothetical protein
MELDAGFSFMIGHPPPAVPDQAPPLPLRRTTVMGCTGVPVYRLITVVSFPESRSAGWPH